MCGIVGFNWKDETLLKGMLKVTRHRGPDDQGTFLNKNISLGHNRLSIIDLSKNGKNPIWNENKTICVLHNGEIYNFKELKKELGYDYQTQSDSEVIIAAYLKWGVDFVQHLRGMFAIALLDNDTLYLFRDRLGKKPLFYLHNSSFVFASEIKALTPFLAKKELDDDALLSYLSFLAPTPPYTFYKGIKKLAAGEYLKLKNNQVEIKRYYDIHTPPNIITNADEAISKLEETLKESISLRLSSDVPMASLLSGGIDSATINYYAKEFGKPLQTYTLGYKEFSKYDERDNARESAKLIGLNNKEIEIDEHQFINAMDSVLDSLDEPLNDPASIPLYLLFGEIKKDGYKVVLSGEGSDELFLGYREYFEYLDIQKTQELAHKSWLKNYFRANYSQNREWEWYKRIFDDTLLFRTSGEKFTDLQKNFLLKRNVKDNQSLKYLQPYRDRFDASEHTDESSWYSYIDLNLFQAEHFLTKLDRVSMAHSIESRTPFLDHKLVNTLFSLSPKLKYEDGVTKSLLKKIMQPHLDESILKRKKKGFSNPYMEYLVNSGKLELIHEVNEQTGFFKRDKLDEYVQGASTGKFKQHVWGLYVLSYWIKKNLL